MSSVLFLQKPAGIQLQDNEMPDYDEQGVDLTLIRWMISLTTAERLDVLQQTVDSFERMRRAKSGH